MSLSLTESQGVPRSGCKSLAPIKYLHIPQRTLVQVTSPTLHKTEGIKRLHFAYNELI